VERQIMEYEDFIFNNQMIAESEAQSYIIDINNLQAKINILEKKLSQFKECQLKFLPECAQQRRKS